MKATKVARKMFRGRGIVVNYLEYWSEKLLDPSLENKVLTVLCHPDDVSTVDVETESGWIPCYCRRYPEMKGIGVPEIKRAVGELRRQGKSANTLSGAAICTFLKERASGLINGKHAEKRHRE